MPDGASLDGVGFALLVGEKVGPRVGRELGERLGFVEGISDG